MKTATPKKFRMPNWAKRGLTTEWRSTKCDQQWFESKKNGQPDYDKLHLCPEWATTEIHYTGNDRPNHYCDKHAQRAL